MFLNVYEKIAIIHPSLEEARESVADEGMYQFTLFKKRGGDWIQLDLSKQKEN